MKFAQKLTCLIFLVLAFSFSAGGCLLLYGEFSERLGSAAEQNEAQHALICYTLENEVLALRARGDALSDQALTSCGQSIAGTTPAGYAAAFTRSGAQQPVYSGLDPALWARGSALQNGQMEYITQSGRVYALYRAVLVDQLSLVSAFDLTPLYAARSRSMQRFLALEGLLLLGSAFVAALANRWMTRPLALLTRASGEIAAGAYDRRTAIPTGDEIGQLSRSFDSMAEAVQEKVEALELSVQQRDDFMGAFTHELKTPMTSILGYADMLRSVRCDPAEQKEAAGAIFHEAQRLEALSQKLLQLLRLTEEPLVLAPLPLPRLWAAVQAAAGPVCAAHEMCLLLPDDAAYVLGDLDLLADLLYNLIHNAVKASKPGQPILVGCLQQGCRRELSVTDFGCGIPPQALARVTEPFYMADKSRARQEGGSGLGLALCRRIALAHGTDLTIESSSAGTRVSLTVRSAPTEGGPL